jgi:hypothetical protein
MTLIILDPRTGKKVVITVPDPPQGSVVKGHSSIDALVHHLRRLRNGEWLSRKRAPQVSLAFPRIGGAEGDHQHSYGDLRERKPDARAPYRGERTGFHAAHGAPRASNLPFSPRVFEQTLLAEG